MAAKIWKYESQWSKKNENTRKCKIKTTGCRTFTRKNGNEWCNKKLLKPGLIKPIVNYVLEKFGLSVRKTCKILGINQTTYLYEKKEKNDAEILARMKEIIKKRPKAGCKDLENQQIIVLLIHSIECFVKNV